MHDERRASRRPRIVAVDHEASTRARLADELDSRYGRHYDVVVARSGEDVLADLDDAASADVALVLAERRDDHSQLLTRVRARHPHAKRALLVGWNENRSAREEVVQLLARGDADYYVTKPMGSPDERFHRAVTELLDDWWRLRGRPYDTVNVIGDVRSARVHEICDLLHRHDFPYAFHSVDSDAGRAALEAAGMTPTREPVVVVEGHAPLVDPANLDVAEALGARTRAGEGTYDVVVIGGGPAGLAAAVYAGSEGLRVALVERTSMGGQAGTSSMIRNYLGFPRGISGAELATRALDQAILFGTEMVYGGDVVALRAEGPLRIVELADGTSLTTRAVVIATGVAYRTLDVPSLDALNGVGVHYGSAMSQARALTGEHVCVVGGGNSAGQAAIHLAQYAAQVTIVVRSTSLAASMSDYLVKSIERTRNIEIRYATEVADGGGDGRLEWIDLRDRSTGVIARTGAAALFVLIGADPCTDWLPPSVARDAWGYIATGGHCDCHVDDDATRAPLMFETTMPGVFAVGDVRQGSVKRVASAAGEGAVCVRVVHEYLDAETPGADGDRS
ncbi:MAG TPA: FAD-dependent oxidoreductase [Acidimicrobiia bacterium]|nr:FAD-dependent oxidoreductase [Acidimicrobiia bacterium]